jgi:hypothetical protein
MTTILQRRVALLEQAPVFSRTVFRVFGSAAEAASDGEPDTPGMIVMRIVTGVPRGPAWAGDAP